ncbi:MAG TPA: alpha/beta hydrolase [Thermoanaerobaculia bacterium]|nr:alpha/beta hydrolase [Thermoanaerobaculia bacterium]
MGLAALGVLAAVVLAFPLAIFFLQDRLIFYPQPLDEAGRAEVRRRFSAEEIFLTAKDGKRLHAWHIRGEPLVIYFGGNAEEVSWMIEQAKAQTPGVGWLLTSYRGYGASEGAPSEAAISADALRWYDYIVEKEKPSRIVAFGRSLGSGPAVYLASRRKLSSVILATPFDSLVAVAKRYYPLLPVGLMLRHRFESVELAPKIEVPLLCLAATHDDVIPPAHARRLYDAWAGPKDWVDLVGAGHNSTDGVPAFWQSIRSFLQESPA